MRSRAVVAAAATTTTTTISYTGGSRRTIKAATTDDSLVISKTLSLQHQAKSQNPHGQLFFWSGAYSLLISAELGGCNFFSSRNLRMDWRPRVKVMNLEPMVAVEVSMEFVEMPPASINNWSGGFLFATNPTHTHERDPAAACSCNSGMVSTATSMSFSVPSPPSSTFSSAENFFSANVSQRLQACKPICHRRKYLNEQHYYWDAYKWDAETVCHCLLFRLLIVGQLTKLDSSIA